jgi:hypothetical protein
VAETVKATLPVGEDRLVASFGTVRAVAVCTVDGRPALVSGGDDGTVRRWDATTGAPIGEPLTGHTGQVNAVATYTVDGRPALASGGVDGTVRRWDATTGAPIGEPLTGHTGQVNIVATYTVDGRPGLVSGSNDGTVRRWDATTGKQAGPRRRRASQHSKDDTGLGWVVALAACTVDGRPALASGGIDRTVRRWDATTGAPIGEPLTGHTGPVLALAAYTIANESRLASVGADGNLLLWDAVSGELLRRVFVAPIQLRGLADRRAVRDLLGRQMLTQELAELLNWHAEADKEPGPTVVTIEGPWGAGKTSIMGLVREQITSRPAERPKSRRLSVRAARKLLRQGSAPRTLTETRNSRQGAVTAWFNPWAHQSSEQVWAGLARAIIDAAQQVLYPDDEDGAQRYWFTRNIAQVDRHALRLRLAWRSVSPLFGLAAVAALSTLVFKVADLKQKTLWPMDWLRVTPGVLALALGGALLLAALVHTAVRYFGRAAALLPAELIRGPVLSGSLAEATPAAADALRDPLYEAKSGYLYLIQHDIDIVLKDLHDAGYDLVVFIDDLDRCSARTTAEVFEAVNLFLSGTTNLDAKFVIGLDPAVVAAHLDKVYEDLADPSLVLHGDDPSPGWAFLRKVVQLPVRVPHIPDESVEHFVAAVLNVPETELQAAATPSSTTAPAARPADPIVQPSPAQAVPAAVQQRRARTGPVERQPEVLDIIRRRLAAQPQRSAREAKRLLNVWQLYYPPPGQDRTTAG